MSKDNVTNNWGDDYHQNGDARDIYALMQRAVDIVADSPHPVNKVAAVLSGKDSAGNNFHVRATNFYPAHIVNALGAGTRVGTASGTVHAEMACILRAPRTKYARVFVTDPPCPNCTKYMAEAGICEIYIDHKGFDKDFAARRGASFAHMSLRICHRAGIKVFKIWRKDRRVECILDHIETYKPPVENPAFLDDLPPALGAFNDPESHEFLTAYTRLTMDLNTKRFENEPFAFCLASDKYDTIRILSANIHPVIGYTSSMHDDQNNKYSFNLQPVNRLLTNAARKGLSIVPRTTGASRVPTAREWVNMLGANLSDIYIADTWASRDDGGLAALKLLRDAGAIRLRGDV